MSKDTGGPAFPVQCQKAGCESIAARFQGHQHLCAKHYRFGQMRASAQRHGKVVPSVARLEALVAAHDGLLCADCSNHMNWLGAVNKTRVASLQHYRDGTLGLVCRSCNTRHAHMEGDSFRDVPAFHKHCPHCKSVKPFSSFAADNSRSGPLKLKSWCKDCSSEAHREWRQSKAA